DVRHGPHLCDEWCRRDAARAHAGRTVASHRGDSAWVLQRPARAGARDHAVARPWDAHRARHEWCRAGPGRRRGLMPRRVFLRKPYGLTGGSFRRAGKMGAMNRLVVALVLALTVAATTVSAADAKTPYRNLIYNDWYQDGQIASTYPISCYRDAL